MITGYIKGQELLLRHPVTASDTIDYLTADFSFSADWDGMDKWVHFSMGDTVYDILLQEDSVSKEAHLNLAAGEWEVWLHGERYENGETAERITTTVARLTVEQSGVTEGEPFPSTPSSAGEQIVAQATAAKDAAQVSATASAASEEAAETAAATAAASATEAEASATAAAASATAAAANASDAALSAEDAQSYAEEIEDLQVSAQGLTAGSDPTVTKMKETGSPYCLHFGIPKGDLGATGKSAYEEALEAGYSGTEAEFSAELASAAQALPQAQSNTARIDALREEADAHTRRIAILEAAARGESYTAQSDVSASCQKTVPPGALPYSTLDSIGGRSVKWNQLVVGGDFPGVDNWETLVPELFTYTTSDHVLSVAYTGTGVGNIRQSVAFTEGHKYLIQGFYKNTGGTGFKALVWGSSSGASVNETDTEWTVKSSISTLTGNSNYFQIVRGNNAPFSCQVKNVRIIDLTEIFGAGNEPANTLDERTKEIMSIADALPSYSPSVTLDLAATSIVSRNAEGEALVTANTSALISTYFPNGMKSVGEIADELNFESGKAIQKINPVSLTILSPFLETPITEAFDAYLPVEAGGSVAFENRLGAAVALPSVVTHYIDVQEAIADESQMS